MRKGFADFAAKKGAKNDDFKTALKMAEWLRDDMKGDVQGKIKWSATEKLNRKITSCKFYVPI